MQYFNNILAVEVGWMIREGIMKDYDYKHLAYRSHDIQVIRPACRNTPALVAYDSMPDRYKKAIVERVGDPRKQARQNVLEGLIEHSAAATTFFEDYMIDDDRHLPADKRREYYTNAVVLDGVKRLIESRNSKRKALGNRATRFWDEISEAVQELDLTKWPHTLPANARSLERKYQRYLAEGYGSLVHKAYQNGSKNAAKVADENQKAMLVTIMSDPRNFDNAQVARLYNIMAQQMDWKKITASAVAVWRDKCDDLIFARRRGEKEYYSTKAMQVKRSAPTRPLLFWTLDGWKAELMYQEKPEKGARVYTKTMIIEVVLDAFTKYPIGFAIGDKENSDLIREALRDAERETERLFGKMYRVAQIQMDNFQKGVMMPIYQAVADKVTPAKVGNAKAKPIEAWFNYLNKKYCQLMPNWSGFGVTSRKELQPNSEFLDKFKKNFPEKDGLIRQLVTIIKLERDELMERYVASFSPEGLQELTMQQYLMAFGKSTEKRYLLQGCGIRCTIGTRKMDYDCFDTHFRKYPSTRWQLRYDPEDPHYAVAVNEDETLQFVLEEKYIQPMALADRKDGDAYELQRIRDFNARKGQEIADEISPMTERAYDLFQKVEDPILSKLLIRDGDGQHKIPKARARLKAAQVAELVEVDEGRDYFDPEHMY